MEARIFRDIFISDPSIVIDLGENLYSKLKRNKNTEFEERIAELTVDDCFDYVYDFTINRAFGGSIPRKSVIEDNLAKEFPNVRFEESDPELDHAGDIDYLGWVGKKAFGIQIKPVTSKSNFDNYSASERMRASFINFTKQYGGQVFVVYSIDDKIKNVEVVVQIAAEIGLLKR
jgi:hypothetical protein